MCAHKRIVSRLALLVLLSGTPLLAADIPLEPYVEASMATPGPLSLFVVPDGEGHPLTRAYNSLGQEVDGTITMTLYDQIPPWGVPVPGFPREDIWLMDVAGGLASCQEGTIPDSDTDALGVTSWSGALMAGGSAEPGSGNQFAINVNGWILAETMLTQLRANSADTNGDGVVNLTDVAVFSSGYFGPYTYAHDFKWDGVVNLSDLAMLAAAIGAQCP